MFNPIKIIVLLLLIGGGYLLAKKMGLIGKPQEKTAAPEPEIKSTRSDDKVETLVECKVCGAYVTSTDLLPGGKAGCSNCVT